jgi:secreted PhoX family phosphatase
MTGISRRALIQGFAAAGAATYVGGSLGAPGAAADGRARGRFTDFRAIAPTSTDELVVPDGYSVDVLLRWGDDLGNGLSFGYNCDYTDFFALRGQHEGVLWVNHEYVIPYYVSDWRKSQDPLWDPRIEPYRSLMAVEKDSVGGTLVHVRRRNGHRWEVVRGSSYNRRFTAAGPVVPYDGPVAGSGLVPAEGVLGSLANCSGGHTPWGTVLSAEENYQSYGLDRTMPFNMGWDRPPGDPNYYTGEVQPQAPPNNLNAYGEPATEVPNYGYVLEVDPYTGAAVKHTALGRLHHENVTLRIARDGRVVAYTGDDAPAADGMLFKFVSSGRWHKRMRRHEAMGLLGDGQLYVAQFVEGANNPAVNQGTGKWHPLDMSDPEACAFTTAWVRANIIPAVGGTTAQFHVPRAEDCEILPGSGRDVVVALTSARRAAADPTTYGALRLIREASSHPDNVDFTWRDLIEGGPESGVANPDNIAFSRGDGLWLTSDISTNSINLSSAFAFHGNNALYHVPLEGRNANVAFRFANAPLRAELTGPTFVGNETLFVSVQHPGEPRDSELDQPIDVNLYPSWWPDGNKTAGTNPSKPKPSVVVITKH